MAEITIRRRRPKADACVLRENSGPHAWVPNMVPSLSAHSAIIFCAISDPKSASIFLCGPNLQPSQL